MTIEAPDQELEKELQVWQGNGECSGVDENKGACVVGAVCGPVGGRGLSLRLVCWLFVVSGVKNVNPWFL